MNNGTVMEASPKAIDEAEDEEECVKVSAAAADKDCKGSQNNKHGPQFTAMKELMISWIVVQVGTYSWSMYGVPYNFFQKAYNDMV